jgi:hypothetical protein
MWCRLFIAVGVPCLAMTGTAAFCAGQFWLARNGWPVPESVAVVASVVSWALATVGPMAACVLSEGRVSRRVIAALLLGSVGFVTYLYVTPFVTYMALYAVEPDIAFVW